MKQDWKVREDGLGWDEVPGKIVGHRNTAKGLEQSRGFFKLGQVLAAGKVGWPKGVYRFRSFEEADAWRMNKMKII